MDGFIPSPQDPPHFVAFIIAVGVLIAIVLFSVAYTMSDQ